MREEDYGYLGFACFFLIIVIIVIAGSWILYNNHNAKLTNTASNNTEVVLTDKLKKDKEKDFIYYTMEESVSDSLVITYKKATINLDSKDAEEVNEDLSKIYDEALASVVKSNDTENICDNASDIYSAVSLEYAIYFYEDTITLLVTENIYSCMDEISKPSKLVAYTFDVSTGKLLTHTDLLNKFGITYTEILEKIEKQLNAQQTILDEVPNIKIEETLNELKMNETYVIYVSETKKLVVKYIVKTNSVDYNDIIELN